MLKDLHRDATCAPQTGCICTPWTWMLFLWFQGFFRRALQDIGDPARKRCYYNKSCDITILTRNRCQYCRLQKCLALGMSRSGRRPSHSYLLCLSSRAFVHVFFSSSKEIKRKREKNALSHWLLVISNFW